MYFILFRSILFCYQPLFAASLTATSNATAARSSHGMNLGKLLGGVSGVAYYFHLLSTHPLILCSSVKSDTGGVYYKVISGVNTEIGNSV
jgi:hypothetical protein